MQDERAMQRGDKQTLLLIGRSDVFLRMFLLTFVIAAHSFRGPDEHLLRHPRRSVNSEECP